jgi:hypothetical protein
MAKHKYVAKLDGKVVGKRSTDRTYTHAVVVQDSEAVARSAAYDYVADESDRENFEYYTAIADLGIRHDHGARTRPYFADHSGERLATMKRCQDEDSSATINGAVESVEGGFDGYVARLRAEQIRRFEERRAEGRFEPYVIGWCGRPDLAQKLAAQNKSDGRNVLGIVAAEETKK